MRTLTICRTRFTDVEDGEYVNPDTDTESVSCDPECDDETAVELVVKELRSLGCSSSSSSRFHSGVWYGLPDGSVIVNYATGEREEVTAHLEGFDWQEEQEVWRQVVGSLNG